VRLVRFEHQGRPQLGIVEDAVLPLDASVDSIAAALADPERARAAADRRRAVALDQVTLLPPVDPTTRVFAVAQNYPSHAQEISGTGAPPQPVLFLKTLSSLVGHGQPMRRQRVTDFFDYEAEVAVVIGDHGHAVAEEEAERLVAGVTAFNDGTGRDLQPAVLGGKGLIDWFSAKCLDASSPIGPWVVPLKDLKGDLNDLSVSCRVNGVEVQRDTTASMVASVARLISFISHRVALRPGDVIATGTPGGVGKARGSRLMPGDVVEVDVEGVGTLRNRVEAA
jgi:2-keto-4-pentenoate hydratase/2-oxohepta-3-ene-1,7-dioic acid hydratase in catechol pathway